METHGSDEKDISMEEKEGIAQKMQGLDDSLSAYIQGPLADATAQMTEVVRLHTMLTNAMLHGKCSVCAHPDDLDTADTNRWIAVGHICDACLQGLPRPNEEREKPTWNQVMEVYLKLKFCRPA